MFSREHYQAVATALWFNHPGRALPKDNAGFKPQRFYDWCASGQ